MFITCKVHHPVYGTAVVKAVCKYDAILQAAGLWEADFEEIEAECTVRASMADIKKVQETRKEEENGTLDSSGRI